MSYVSRCPKDLYSILYLYDSLLWYTGGTKYMGHRDTGTPGGATLRGYPIAVAIELIVPVPLICAEPNWLGRELYLLRCAPQVQYVQSMLLLGLASA